MYGQGPAMGYRIQCAGFMGDAGGVQGELLMRQEYTKLYEAHDCTLSRSTPKIAGDLIRVIVSYSSG